MGKQSVATATTPGFDGAEFGFEEARDLSGKDKRQIVRRIRYDVVSKLCKQGVIEKYQRDAAERLQLDWSLASCIPTAKAGTARGNYSDFGMAQAITDARRRHGDAMRLWKEPERGFIEAIVLHNLGLISARRAFGIAKHKASETFRDCLSILADHYDRQSCGGRELGL